jgi:glycerate 2-kinase
MSGKVTTMRDPTNFLKELFDTAVAAAQPTTCLPPALPEFPENGDLIVLATGKAAAAMAKTAIGHYRQNDPDCLSRIRGLVTTRHGYGLETSPLDLIEAGHPVPDDASILAARKSLEIARSAKSGDLVLVLLSGGGSALWSAPTPPLDLPAKQAITKSLLRSGATISEINIVRRHLSDIKGGRLASAVANRAPVVTIAISDVPGDDPAAIASGPTVADPTTGAQALAICDRFGIEVSGEVRKSLEKDKISSRISMDNEFRLAVTPAVALEAAAAKAREAGFTVTNIGDALEGEARDRAREHAQKALEMVQSDRPAMLISGGELTVTIHGEGKGGPNQEYALTLAIALDGHPDIEAIAGDTDGADGGSGAATDPAGAIIGPNTLLRANAAGIDPSDHLMRNDSTSFFKALGDSIVTGPTYTNVNDFRAIMVNRKLLI